LFLPELSLFLLPSLNLFALLSEPPQVEEASENWGSHLGKWNLSRPAAMNPTRIPSAAALKTVTTSQILFVPRIAVFNFVPQISRTNLEQMSSECLDGTLILF
jgi:hypothetical protein